MIESAAPAFFWISCRLIFHDGKSLPVVGLWIALYSFIPPALSLINEVDRGVDEIVDDEILSNSSQFIKAAVDKVDSDSLVVLKQLMEAGFYRRENLTLKILAKEMSLPEYRIRAVINKELNYRNFNEFINAYRILEAAQRLIDEPETPISNIALDVGYRSLSSFNRDFRKEKKYNSNRLS